MEAYKEHILKKYKGLLEKYYLEYYATEPADLWLEKSTFALDEEEMQRWHDAIAKCQEEEQAFHNTVYLENYEGEREQEICSMTSRYLKGPHVRISCGKGSRCF